jgi:hypothetical protein
VSWPSLASLKPQAWRSTCGCTLPEPSHQPPSPRGPICLCRDACFLAAAERAGNTLYGARVYVELGSRLAHAHASRKSRPNSLSQLGRDGWSAESFTFTLGPLKASANALLNDRAFELSKNAEHLKHGLACWRGRIETLLMQKQALIEHLQLMIAPTSLARASISAAFSAAVSSGR